MSNPRPPDDNQFLDSPPATVPPRIPLRSDNNPPFADSQLHFHTPSTSFTSPPWFPPPSVPPPPSNMILSTSFYDPANVTAPPGYPHVSVWDAAFQPSLGGPAIDGSYYYPSGMDDLQFMTHRQALPLPPRVQRRYPPHIRGPENRENATRTLVQQHTHRLLSSQPPSPHQNRPSYPSQHPGPDLTSSRSSYDPATQQDQFYYTSEGMFYSGQFTGQEVSRCLRGLPGWRCA